VLKLSEKIMFKPEEKIVFDEKLSIVRHALQQLGEVI
jgi:hypothetical protein